MSGMNDKGNRYALTALRNKRATIAAEIVQLERQDGRLTSYARNSAPDCDGTG